MENRKIIKDNKEYIRVSDVVAAFRGCYDPRIKNIIERKAQIGSEVHHMCSQYVLGEPVPPASCVRCQKYFECFKAYYDNHVLLDGPLLSEERFFDDELMITGQVDYVFKIKSSNEHLLLDIKTSAQAEPFHWELQGSLYAKMIQQSGISLANSFTFVQLFDDGNKPAAVYTFPGWKRGIDQLTACVKELLNFQGDFYELQRP